MSDNIANTSHVWKPRLRVTVGEEGVRDPTAAPNTVVPTALSAQTLKSNWYQADRHKVTFSLWDDPAFGYAFWAKFNSMSIMVEIAFEGVVDYTEVFRGFVDKVVIDTIKGIVTCTGRNVLGLLIDARMIQFTPNPTVGDLINQIFEQAHLHAPDLSAIPDVAGQPTGREFLDEQIVGSVSDKSLLNPMDLLHTLCTNYGLTMSEDGGVVHFFKEVNENGDIAFTAIAPQPTYEQSTASAGNVMATGVTKLSASNCTQLILEHDLNISEWNWVMVPVNSDNAGEVTADNDYPNGINLSDPLTKPYPIHSANKNAADNAAYGQSMYQEFKLHEYALTAKVSGPQIIGLKLNQQIALEGTGTIVDGWFALDSIEHAIDFQRGYTGTVKGRWGRYGAGGA